MKLEVHESRPRAGTAVLRIVGSIDLQSKAILADAGQSALKSPDVSALTLDLAAVDFMDSTGIGALVDLAARAGESNVAFAIADPSARVRRILEVTGLSRAWRVESSAATDSSD